MAKGRGEETKLKKSVAIGMYCANHFVAAILVHVEAATRTNLFQLPA